MIFKKIFLKVFITGFFCFFLVLSHSYARIDNNGAGGGYEDGSGEDLISGESGTIEAYIVEGAGYFLKANSDIQLLLRLVELQDLQGIDFQDIQAVVNSTLENMNNLRQTYERLIQKAETTPYNQSVINVLKNFAYEAFMKENGLNGEIFEKVRGFLQTGDITGVFKYTYSRYQEIIELLNVIKQAVSGNKLPVLSIFWQLNENTSYVSYFGSYVARVFAGIR